MTHDDYVVYKHDELRYTLAIEELTYTAERKRGSEKNNNKNHNKTFEKI